MIEPTLHPNRWYSVGGIAIVVVGIAFAAFFAWYLHAYDVWPGESLPGRIHHCHRYYGDGNRVPIEDAPRLEYEFEFAPPLSPNHKVYAEPRDRFTNDLGEQCPMAYWMRDGDAYLLFGLEGGP